MAVEPGRLSAQGAIGENRLTNEEKDETNASSLIDTATEDKGRHNVENSGNTSEEDLDAEGDTDAEVDAEDEDDNKGDEAAVESDADAEVESVSGGDDGDVYEKTHAVKLRKRKLPSRLERQDEEVEFSERGSSEESENESHESNSSESESENEWEAESDDEEDVSAEAADPNSCWFCKQTEENDPSEEYEEYLACAVCGDNAHRQCARDANALQSDEDAKHWRCPTCVEHGLEEETVDGERRRSSPLSSRMQKDLLPSHRDSTKSSSHSVFNTLILDDDPMDGSRSLRKRKSSADEDDQLTLNSRKRRRKSDTIASVDDLASPGSGPSTIHVASCRNDDSTEAVRESEVEGSEPVRSARLRRNRKVDKPLVRVVKPNTFNLVLAFRLGAARLSKILSSKPKKKRIRDRSRKMQIPPPEPEVSHYPAIQTTNWAAALYSFNEKENDELRSKPYGGILSEAEADTSKTFPMAPDRKRFEDARQKAEEDWKKKIQAANIIDPSRQLPKLSGPPSKIKCINFGGYEIDTWHAAPYPEEYSRNKLLYICEFCLKYMNSDYVAWRHKLKCPAKHPPGDEIYRDGPFSFFEVDGRKNPVYCQNLCLLAKLFLGSKTLYYDVEPFLFYIMTENDEFGCHFVGYFSKEKRPSSQNNVSCILVLPIHQRRGFGHLLIEFSYLLTRVEKKTGSPEKPLSDMGLVSYRSYWRLILCYQLREQRQPLSITQLSERTGMTADDIVSALEGLRALVRDPVTKTYALRLDHAYLDEYVGNYEKKGYVKLNPDALIWTPYVMGRGNLATYEQGPALQTVAPREGDGDTSKAPEEGVQMANGTGSDPTMTIDINASKLTLKQAIQAEESIETDGPMQRNEEAAASDAPSLMTPQQSFSSRPRTPGLLVNGHHGNTAAESIQPTPIMSSTNPTTAIPPTRFEVFPPIPGAASRRRAAAAAARPFARTSATATTSSSRRNGGITPTRSSRASDRLAEAATNGAGAAAAETMSPARRTRSKLADLVNGDAEGEDGGGGVVEGFAAAAAAAAVVEEDVVVADPSAPEERVEDGGDGEQVDRQGARGEQDPMTAGQDDGVTDVTMEDA